MGCYSTSQPDEMDATLGGARRWIGGYLEECVCGDGLTTGKGGCGVGCIDAEEDVLLDDGVQKSMTGRIAISKEAKRL
eukprot:9992127-Ditylum_brightwellii.AAC.1